MISKRKDRGFSLVELGIVLGVIAILSLVLVSARFFIESAKIGATVQMVNSVRQASRAYAKRVCGGIGYSCPAQPPISVPQLQAQNLLPGPPNGAMCSPWCTACNPPGVCGVGVVAAGAGNVDLRIGICVGADAATRADITQALNNVGAVGGAGPCGPCPAGSACLGLTTR